MCSQIIEDIRRSYGLGTQTVDLSQATESQHSVWRLTTDNGSYAVKKLNSKSPSWIDRYEATERIAGQFADLDVSTVSAIRTETGVTSECDGELYVVYPWVDGTQAAIGSSESQTIDVTSRHSQRQPHKRRTRASKA